MSLALNEGNCWECWDQILLPKATIAIAAVGTKLKGKPTLPRLRVKKFLSASKIYSYVAI